MKLILDVENSFTDREYKSRDDVVSYVRDISPYNPNNKLISVGLTLEPFKEKKYFCFFHNKEEPDKNGHANVQKYLDQCTLLIGHNIKHDLSWLRACGFVYEGDVWDTNITEYVLLRGQKQSLKLKDLAERRNLTRKKSDLVQEYFDKGVSLENVDWEIVEEYGLGDIQTTLELYLDQCARLDTEDNRGLYNTIHMMNEFCKTIVYMEGNGIKIDLEELQRVKQEFLAEFIDVQDRLYKLAHAVMGDTPVDLNSPDFKSELIYSRKVLDKKEWKEVFNIGTDYRGKPLKPPRMSPHQFGKAVKALTRPIRKTKAHQCPECEGKGWYRKVKKDGEPFKKTSCCPKCEGTGLVYEELPEIAGFRVIPKDASYTAQAGFVTDAETIDELLRTASQGQAREFLEGLSRYNALRTYLSTFVEGIEKHVQNDGILHTNLNQTITSTGRLSSTKPNFQNLPRGKTFPVKRAITSRFLGGRILECDYRTLEYRIAGYLSGCPAVRHAIETNEDAHAFTRDTINAFDENLPQIDRQDAKPHTFKPLYGGMSGTPREVSYYKAFLEKHAGVAEWHERLKAEAIATKRVCLPSGREYSFPYAKRLTNGYVNQTTSIVNYPVQGFATADVVPLGIIATHRLFVCHKLRSLLILTVHDSLEVDNHPDEFDIAEQLVKEGMLSIPAMMRKFYNMEFDYPIDVELKAGPNWFSIKDI